MGDSRTDGCAGSPTGTRASHSRAGTESCVWAGNRPGRSVDRNSVGRKPPIGGTERDKPRNPLHRGRRPVGNGGEGSSDRSFRRERTRVHRGLSRRHAETGSARNPGEPAIGPATWPGASQARQSQAGRGGGGCRIGPYYRGSGVMPVEGRGRRTSASSGHAWRAHRGPVPCPRGCWRLDPLG